MEVRIHEFLKLLPQRADNDHSWTVTRDEIEAKNYDLKAVNPHDKAEEDTRTPGEPLDFIEMKGHFGHVLPGGAEEMREVKRDRLLTGSC